MIIDNELAFSNPQTVTTSTNTGLKSTGLPDMKAIASRLGAGEPLYIVAVVTTALAMDSTQGLRVSLITDDNATLTSAAEVQEVGTFAANSAAGTRIVAALNPSGVYERYIGLLYKTTTGNALSAGAVKAFIVKDADATFDYPAGSTIQTS